MLQRHTIVTIKTSISELIVGGTRSLQYVSMSRGLVGLQMLWIACLTLGMQSLAKQSRAEITLPRVFGSRMVLQREMPVPIWGMATPGEQRTHQPHDYPAVKDLCFRRIHELSAS
jgi:hypothetical protein